MRAILLLPKPPQGQPIKRLERLWLDTACLYEVFDETLMEDTDWDHFAKELNDRKAEWSPYFKAALGDGWEDWNVGTTASGVNWNKGLGLIVKEHLQKLAGNYTSLLKRHSYPLLATI